MAARSLKSKILLSLVLVILVLAVSIALLGFYVIQKNIIERAEDKVRNDLTAARMVYTAEIDRIGRHLRLFSLDTDAELFRDKLNLDYLQVVTPDDFNGVRSEIVAKAVEQKAAVGGTRLISNEELEQFNSELQRRAAIAIVPTPMARPTDRRVLAEVMAKEYAMPVINDDGTLQAVVYGGRIINRDFTLVDRIRAMVFGNEQYDGKPIGTVTIFQDDVRISTNVINPDGTRAIGTRVSAPVYGQVVERGKIWHDRAFVVADWYKTAYEPIRNVNGRIIGILYVGTLEEPFNDMAREMAVLFLMFVGLVTVLAVILSIVLAGAISKPLTNVLEATVRLSSGELGYRVNAETGTLELDRLADSFNQMSAKLEERDQKLRISNEELKALNKSYVDLIGFVAHELKGILASAVMNAYAVRDGFLGMINFKQRKAMDSVTRNLDYLGATVKKFLNLGRIERDELSINRTDLRLKKDVFDVSIGSLEAVSQRKGLQIENEIPDDLAVHADLDLMQIVANNLVSNAIKYSFEKGLIRISGEVLENMVRVEVYNDSTPIGDEQKRRLFQKFSRLDNPETKKEKGTGLGLYITKQIVEGHGGRIWVEPAEHGNTFIFEIERGL